MIVFTFHFTMSDYSYEEDMTQPEFDFFNSDLSQMFHAEQLPPPEPPIPSPPPQVKDDDSSLAYSTSLRQSKELLTQALGYPASKIKYQHPHGLVILPLECFNAIRDYDNPPRQPIPHIMYLPRDTVTRLNHPEFQFCLAAFYGASEK